ncbi:hypothetical protein AAVH_23589 [Aphelenchoides avenae]|nr:hypothetical protein AAVH_23589 [Aphelenchus avenae]
MKVLIRLRVYDDNDDVVQRKDVSVETQRTDTLRGVLRNAIRKARWNENGLRTHSIRLYDQDFDTDVDVEEDERPVHLGQYRVELEEMPPVAVATPSPSPPTAAATSAVKIEQNEDTPVEFYVKSLSGQKLTFYLLTSPEYPGHRDVLATDTVKTLKEKIEYLDGIPTRQQRLISSQGREMRNEQTLREFPQLAGSTIELTM